MPSIEFIAEIALLKKKVASLEAERDAADEHGFNNGWREGRTFAHAAEERAEAAEAHALVLDTAVTTKAILAVLAGYKIMGEDSFYLATEAARVLGEHFAALAATEPGATQGGGNDG